MTKVFIKRHDNSGLNSRYLGSVIESPEEVVEVMRGIKHVTDVQIYGDEVVVSKFVNR